MEGADLCQEIVKRASSGFVYSEAVARYVTYFPSFYAVDSSEDGAGHACCDLFFCFRKGV